MPACRLAAARFSTAARVNLTPALLALRNTRTTRCFDIPASKGTTFLEPDVYSTPAMIWDMEWAVRETILEQLHNAGLEGWDSVGTSVTFEHIAATPVGERVTLELEVVAVGDDRPTVEATAVFSDAMGELGRGTHRRMVADMRRLQTRISERQSKLRRTRL